jgi:hypothetical protein
MENYQRADGSIEIPEVLRPYMGGVSSLIKTCIDFVHSFCFSQSDRKYRGVCGNFPISLKLQQQRCLIVGGGHIAYRKASLLVKAGAIIDVVAPEIEPDLMN